MFVTSWWYTGCLEEVYSFLVEMDNAWWEDLVQAAWAYTKRGEGWGVPEKCDRDEGWILNPRLLPADS